MARGSTAFLFTSLGSKEPSSSRKTHIRRLFDVLEVCIQRHDWPRAKRAWAILARCGEVGWKTMWTTSGQDNAERIRFLSVMMRQYPEEVRLPDAVGAPAAADSTFPRQRESILKELVLRLIQSGAHRRAMEELDLYLPSYPYQDNPALHTYAGMIALYLAQPSSEPAISEETTFGPSAPCNKPPHVHR
ncbi:uncharacterized protein BXZ73DRAFT_40340 [Epithele typhae]|uniref:uncharacterized protein n=1 Tax=Epithele typhae TaxID=378194 RepID=UPI0020076BAB|nr:uncharacterized protein BXZ73DRAFT_40340 [Epithele typhae]KAH9943305.1 hypothetical protein BXZ73DRAFT_40340 [Epithele typhae]